MTTYNFAENEDIFITLNKLLLTLYQTMYQLMCNADLCYWTHSDAMQYLYIDISFDLWETFQDS